LAVLAAGLGFVVAPRMTAADDAASAYKPVLPEAEFGKLVNDDAKIIQDSLAKASSDKKMAAKAKMSALMIAVYAQGAMAKPGAKTAELAGLRDAALKLGKAVTDGNFDEARKIAADLKPQGKPEAGAKPVVAVHEPFDTDILMQQFKPERGGGLGMENTLNKLKDKRQPLTPDEVKQATLMSYRIAAIAQATEAMAPAKDMGKKTRAEWIKLSREMGTLALDVTKDTTAAKPDDKKVKAALKKLEANCTNCHTTFRDN